VADPVIIVGLTAATLTTLALIPQVVKTWRLKKAKDISLGMYILSTAGISMWLAYGLLVGDVPLIFANALSLVLTITVLLFVLKFGK
jgi:MtN3 and saliva related transmembrane protein